MMVAAGTKTNGRGGADTAALLTFLVLTFGWTWGLWAIVTLPGLGLTGLGGGLMLASAYGPGVAAVVTVLAFEGRVGFGRWIRRCLRWRLGWGWYVLALFGPPLLMMVALGLNLASGGAMGDLHLPGDAMTILSQIAMVTVLGGPLGEEFGWRGYALPALTRRLGWRWAAVLLGAIWALWHVPLFFIPGMAQTALPMAAFLAGTVALSAIFARLSVNTGFSVLPAIMMHAAINLASAVLPVMPVAGDARAYLIVSGLMIVTAGLVLMKPGPQMAKVEIPNLDGPITAPDGAVQGGPGLTPAEAAARLATDGPNELPRARRRSSFRIVLDVLREPMLALLLAGGVVYLLLGSRAEALILLAFACMDALRAVVADAETQMTTSEKVFESLAAVGDDTENLKGAMAEMTRLEERMKTIIETGSTLVRRLQPEAG